LFLHIVESYVSMKKHVFILSVFLLGYLPMAIGQNVPVLKFGQFEPLLYKQNDTLYLVNFWATWCIPCVKEVPAIEKVAADFAGQKFKVILVSLDAAGTLNNRLIPFINKNNIQSDVILLNDPDFNSWINKVDSNWSGSIPASIIYLGNMREFYEQSFTYEELKQLIQTKIVKQ
jgi:thiol-disulfide isomerase/thioredoxin